MTDLDGETCELTAGDVIRVDGQRDVSPYAVEEGEALIVLAQRTDRRDSREFEVTASRTAVRDSSGSRRE